MGEAGAPQCADPRSRSLQRPMVQNSGDGQRCKGRGERTDATRHRHRSGRDRRTASRTQWSTTRASTSAHGARSTPHRASHVARPAGSARAAAYPRTAASQPEVDIAHVNPQGHWLDDARPRAPHERPAFRALRATQGGRLESDSPSTRDALGPTCRPRARVRTPTLNRAVAGVSERRHRPAPPTCWRSASLLDKPLQPALPPHQVRPRSRGMTPLRAACVDRASRSCRVLLPIFDTTVDLVNSRPFTHPIEHDPVRGRHPSVDAASTAAPAAVGTAVDASR